MRIKSLTNQPVQCVQTAFSLVETMVATAVISVAFVSLYAGFSSGFQTVQMGRENLRATQVILEKFETIRLYSWEQINMPGFIPATFTAPFNPSSNAIGGFTYQGTVKIEAAPVLQSYSTDLRQVTVDVTWTNANVARHRAMSTLVSRYGLQNYVY
jgi:prepilin-type N-terminal cleavage/methylation domain-containing protein